jgi:hypothetical protein
MAVGIPHAGDWANRPALVKMRPAAEGPAGRWQGNGPPLTLRRRALPPGRAWQAVSRRPADAG